VRGPRRDPSKPKYRGVSHELACYGSAIAGCFLVSKARGPGESNLALIGAMIYSLCLFFQFAASALYHRPNWGPRARARMRKVDHCAIFFLIAGSATPVALLGLSGQAREAALCLMWAGALLGAIRSLFWPQAPKPIAATAFVLLGLSMIPFMPQIAIAVGLQHTLLLCYGAAMYIAGAAVYALRRPDPVPMVFGYHEVFHALVVAAAACQFMAIYGIVADIASF
jgi:hemolysin III